MNPWLEHVKKVRAMKKNAKKSYKEILQVAKLTYKRKYSHDKIAGPRKSRAKKRKVECKTEVESTVSVSQR